MPNWCSNRMYFSGEPAQIAEIKRLASGAVTPLYRRATKVFSCFWPEVPDFCRSLKISALSSAPGDGRTWCCITGKYRVHLADTPAERCTAG
ncbi:hypothetical protein BANRA_05575 [Escherichia coli]|nr:hypothetical protein BANRA_05575 [Escherichia coli]